MFHLPEGERGRGFGNPKWDIPKNQCKIDPFGWTFSGGGRGSETLKNRKFPWDVDFERSLNGLTSSFSR